MRLVPPHLASSDLGLSPRLHLPPDHRHLPKVCPSAPPEASPQESANLNPKRVAKQWTHLQAPRHPNVTVPPTQLQQEAGGYPCLQHSLGRFV